MAGSYGSAGITYGDLNSTYGNFAAAVTTPVAGGAAPARRPPVTLRKRTRVVLYTLVVSTHRTGCASQRAAIVDTKSQRNVAVGATSSLAVSGRSQTSTRHATRTPQSGTVRSHAWRGLPVSYRRHKDEEDLLTLLEMI